MNPRPVAMLAAVVALVVVVLDLLGVRPPVVLLVAALVAGVAAAVTFPHLTGALAARARPTRPRTPGAGAVAPPREQAGGDALTTWSDDELYRAWQISYIRLRRLQRLQRYGDRGPAHIAQITRLAHERGRYMDELERRHPAGVGAWVAGRGRATGRSG